MRRSRRNDIGQWAAFLSALAVVLHELNVLLLQVILPHVHLFK